MKKRFLYLILAMIMVFSLLSTSAFAMEAEGPSEEVYTANDKSPALDKENIDDTLPISMDDEYCSQPSVTVEEIPTVSQSRNAVVMPLGVMPPSNTWDLSKDDYSGTIYFNTSIFTNNKFSNHDGNIYITLYSEIDDDDPYNYTDGYCIEVNLCRKGLLGDSVYESTVEVEIGKSWIISFTNWDPKTEYYIIFSQPYSHRAWNVDGNFTVSKTEP